MRRDYVEGCALDQDGDPIYKDLATIAAEYGIHSAAIRARSAKEKWVDQRAAFRAKVEMKRLEYRAKELGKRRVAVDERAYALAIKGLTIIARGLEKIELDVGATVDSLVMARYMTAIVRAQQAAMLATGEGVEVSPLARSNSAQPTPNLPQAQRLIHVVYEKSPPIAERVREYE